MQPQPVTSPAPSRDGRHHATDSRAHRGASEAGRDTRSHRPTVDEAQEKDARRPANQGHTLPTPKGRVPVLCAGVRRFESVR